jgi:uncharacterized glyoxalase superfamily protein PhnB
MAPEPFLDPFVSLRAPAPPLAPRPEFATDLRRRIERELGTLPPGEPTATAVIPYLSVVGASDAIAFYAAAFGAVEDVGSRFVSPDDGRIGHAQFSIGRAQFMISDAYPEIGVTAPEPAGTPVSVYLVVTDVDAVFARAVAAGAVPEREPADQFHGNRNAVVRDPFGHRWMLSMPIAGAHHTSDRTGSLYYFTLAVPDFDRATTFFGSLLGWQFERGGHIANIPTPGGMHGPAEPGLDLYFVVDDIHVAARRVRELGGHAEEPILYASGWSVECDDGQGTKFYLSVPAPGY